MEILKNIPSQYDSSFITIRQVNSMYFPSKIWRLDFRWFDLEETGELEECCPHSPRLGASCLLDEVRNITCEIVIGQEVHDFSQPFGASLVTHRIPKNMPAQKTQKISYRLSIQNGLNKLIKHVLEFFQI